MRIGALRNRIRLQNTAQTNPVADTYGLADAYTDTCEIWANVEQLTGERRYLDLSQRYLISYRVTIRWRDDVTQTSRFVFGSRYLYVNDIAGDKAQGSMTLFCYEKAVS